MQPTTVQFGSPKRGAWSLTYLGFICCLVCLSTGCSAVIWKFPPAKAQSSAITPIEGKTETKARREAPLEVTVAQAFFAEDKLSVKVRVHTKTKLDPKAVQVTVSGLREGQVVEEQAQKISEVVASEILPADTTLIMPFSLSAQELTEYQIRCSWGEQVAAGSVTPSTDKAVEATGENGQLPEQPESDPLEPEVRASLALPPTDAPEPFSPPLELPKSATLEGVEVDEQPIECSSPPCDRLLTLSARVRNNSTSVMASARLAIGLYWVNSGMLPKIPAVDAPLAANEELIELSDLNIAPGQAKRIRVKVDRKVPVVPGGSFVPHLRVLGDSGSE